MKRILIAILGIIAIAGVSCTHEENNYGFISLNFIHEVNGETLKTDTLEYINEAENYFSVHELKYFISNVSIIKSDGTVVPLSEYNKIIYIDNELAETKYIELPDSIQSGVYKSLSFTFGIEESDNQYGLFTTPPESFMESPEELGGGYNYLRMSGRYTNIHGVNEKEYDFFLGIGTIHPSSGLGADEVSYVHNNFPVLINDLNFELNDKEEVTINIEMEILNWFRDPHTWNFQRIGSNIADNQDAQLMARENGHNVFSAFVIKDRKTK